MMNVSTDSAEPGPDEPVLRELLIGVQRQRGRAVGALGEHVGQVEDPQRVERPEDQRDEDRRAAAAAA